ncbi:uncharacterized protein LOC129589576 [Paramacrobiotus metropolitanus]|uniref:uncharacterized protein LOC129589576 n=1 Tax=Paramacrobiotus metropolitanus TaxID=2943436 RepID=UPI0024461762|nr:uncharacterized protein LOC129589576 [Paramacrobiotus metropolitanus]
MLTDNVDANELIAPLLFIGRHSEAGCLNHVAVTKRFSFKDTVTELSVLDDELTRVLECLGSALSPIIIALIIGNSAYLAARTSLCFIEGAAVGITKIMDVVTALSFPPLHLGFLLYFAGKLHETSSDSIDLWRRLIKTRQLSRTDGDVKETWSWWEEDACLLVRLKLAQFRSHALVLFQTADFNRRFGNTLVTVFLGFVCFVIERSENYNPVPSPQIPQPEAINHTITVNSTQNLI